ncbi:MAG: hypothetical protein RLY70_4050 [Planctomycetota bacterium]
MLLIVCLECLACDGENVAHRANYLHLLARGKAKKLSLVACMRKLLTILNTLLTNDVLWSNEKIAPGPA